MKFSPGGCCSVTVGTLLFLLLCSSLALADNLLPVPKISYAPRHCVCYRTSELITIDGRLDEPAWQQVIPTESFVDIEGDLKPSPCFDTRARMLWDSVYFYVAAEMVEPHVWASLTERDAVIYHDNDFEVFIDPNADTHEYYELELNALNTVWDLLLIKPYRDGGPAVNAWDIQGLKTAVWIDGTLNNPDDKDAGWSVEIAIPWRVLAECAHRPAPPRDGDQWRVNFSRVEWQTEVKDGRYVKRLDSASGQSLPEDNWVWSPQGLIAMHYPEMWGIVQFTTAETGSRDVGFVEDGFDPVRWALRRLYYAETDYRTEHGRYTSNWSDLSLDDVVGGFAWPPTIGATTDQFEAKAASTDGAVTFVITQDGRLDQKIMR